MQNWQLTGPDQGFLVSPLVLTLKPWERGWRLPSNLTRCFAVNILHVKRESHVFFHMKSDPIVCRGGSRKLCGRLFNNEWFSLLCGNLERQQNTILRYNTPKCREVYIFLFPIVSDARSTARSQFDCFTKYLKLFKIIWRIVKFGKNDLL
jgi:hypothetical protein